MRSRVFQIGKLKFRFNWLVAAAVVSTVLGLSRLGTWQLDRAAQKLRTQERFQTLQEGPAVAVENVVPEGRAVDGVKLQNRQVRLVGRYLNERSIFLIYRSYEDQIGYEILTPFKLAARNEWVLVSRGWTGAASYEALRQSLPVIPGEQQLLGQIYVPTAAEAARSDPLDKPRWPLLARHVNTEQLTPLFSAPLFPYVVRLNEGQNGVLVRYWPQVTVNTSRHFSYALQWFAMAIAVAAASLLLSSNLPELLGYARPPRFRRRAHTD